jgi:hypothetical protein
MKQQQAKQAPLSSFSKTINQIRDEYSAMSFKTLSSFTTVVNELAQMWITDALASLSVL